MRESGEVDLIATGMNTINGKANSTNGSVSTNISMKEIVSIPSEVNGSTDGMIDSQPELNGAVEDKLGRFSRVSVEKNNEIPAEADLLTQDGTTAVTVEEVTEKTQFLDKELSESSQTMSYMELLSVTGGDNLFLYGEPSNLVTAFLKGFTVPGPRERAESKYTRKQVNLGVMLGVYLPTIQHILGVTMFIRLFWVVGIAGIFHTFVLLALCCSCARNLVPLSDFCFISLMLLLRLCI